MEKWQTDTLYSCFDGGLKPHDIPGFLPAINLGEAKRYYTKWVKKEIERQRRSVSFLDLEFNEEKDLCKGCFFEKDRACSDCCASDIMRVLTGKDCSEGFIFQTKKETK